MKSIKQIVLGAFLFVSSACAVLYTSCTKDKCKDVTCQNGGTCSDGKCTCPTGYEGTNCETLSRAKFIGTYVGSEICATGTDNYSISLAANSDNLKLTYSNLYNNTPSITATCTMAATDSFTFSGTQATITFNGSGRLVGNALTVHYTITDGTNNNTCTFIGSK